MFYEFYMGKKMTTQIIIIMLEYLSENMAIVETEEKKHIPLTLWM